MFKFALGRLMQAVPVLLVVITVTFFLVHSAPGGPFDADKAVPPEVLKALEAQYNLDQPMWKQYLSYLGDVVQGDLGPSFKYSGRTVNELIGAGLPTTAELAFYAMLVALGVGITAGITASMRPNTMQDYIPMSAAMIGICMPSFLLGPLLVLIFGIHLEWLPVSGWGDIPGDKILPSITLGTAYAAYIARLSRGGMLEVLSQDYIRTAFAKGIAEKRVVWIHAFRNSIIPIAAQIGYIIAAIIASSYFIERVFNINGFGKMGMQAILDRDYPIMMGFLVIVVLIRLIANIISDLAIASVDPRIRFK